MKAQINLALFVTLELMFGNCFAYTSIASIDGYVFDAWFRSSNYESQKEADAAALEGCRTEARKNGIGHLVKQCKIALRAKVPGYGAIVCGDKGCSYVTGYESAQAAADAAYQDCSNSYTNCKGKDISTWKDFAGFPSKKPSKLSAGDCRPRTATLSCQSSCNNGDCIVTYENGCKMRVQVQAVPKQVSERVWDPAKYNSITNTHGDWRDDWRTKWEYPSPQCDF